MWLVHRTHWPSSALGLLHMAFVCGLSFSWLGGCGQRRSIPSMIGKVASLKVQLWNLYGNIMAAFLWSKQVSEKTHIQGRKKQSLLVDGRSSKCLAIFSSPQPPTVFQALWWMFSTPYILYKSQNHGASEISLSCFSAKKLDDQRYEITELNKGRR